MTDQTTGGTGNVLWEQIKKELALDKPDGVCPRCGYCPHCGRGGYQTIPYYPYHPYPLTPYPWWQYPTWSGTGTTTIGSQDAGTLGTITNAPTPNVTLT